MNILHNLIRYFNALVLYILSYIIPKKKGLYIFGGNNGKTFSGNSKSMFLYLNKLNKNIFYHIRNKKHYTYLKSDKRIGKKLIYINTIQAYYNTLRAEYIFTDNDFYDIISALSYQPGNFSVINLWHGDPIKKIGYLSQAQHSKHKQGITQKIFQHYFVNIMKFGCSSSHFFKNILNTGHFTLNYKVTGLPRNDIFFEEDLEFFNVKDKFTLQNYKDIILYTPTRRQDSHNITPFSENFLEKLNTYMEKENSIFIIKAHQNSDTILKKRYSHIIDISKEVFDVQELMKYSTMMITDYSSIFIDFMLLDKPILFYAYDYEKYEENLVNLVDSYENCVIKEGVCYDEKVLLSKITDSRLFEKKSYTENYLALKNKYHTFQNGGYCKNILELIKNYAQ